MKFDDLNETFDVAGDIVEATKDVKVTKPLPERTRLRLGRTMNIQGVIFIV